MADDTTPPDTSSADPGSSDTTGSAVDFFALGEQVFSGGFKNLTADGASDVLHNAILKAVAGVAKLVGEIGGPAALLVGKAIAAAVEDFAPVAGELAAPVVAGMFGGEVDAAAFASAADSSGRNAAAATLVDTFLANLTGGASGPIEPGDDGARRIAAAGLHAAIEGWFLSAVPELIGDCIPAVDLHLEPLARLPEEVTRALGVGRLVRGALRPLVAAVATTPMQWQVNTQYRPTKLAANVAIKQFIRGQWTRDTLNESLARDGYRDEDIDALINDAQKFEPLADLAERVWLGLTDQDGAVQTLGDQGFDQQTASKLLITFGLRQLDAVHRRVAAAAITAFVDGRIDQGTRDTLINSAIANADERKALQDAADAERACHVKPLTSTEAEACVLASIVPISDYTAALEREGRDPDAIDALELLLRWKIDKATAIEQHKEQLQAARDAAAKAKAAAAALHQQTVQAAAARKELGALGTLDRAYVHGLIPIDRVSELLNLEFPADTVAIYTADLEQRHAAWLAQQQKAADATKKAKAKGLSVGALRTAFIDGILTGDQVRSALAAGGLDGADVETLIATWQHTIDAQAAAAKLHADAQARAAARRLSLGNAETLTVNGHWSIADFNAWLATLGYDAADQAHLDLIVQDRIAKLKAAAAVKKTATAANPTRGLTLGQLQRAVVLGDRTMQDLQSWLVAEGFTADAVSVLVAETQEAVNAADAARARRATPATADDGRPVALADVTRAARLGLLSVADYTAELQRRGYTPDAIALDLQLLATEIAQAKQPAPAAGSATAAIAASGQAPVKFATLRHATIDGELAGKGLSLAEVESAVKAGTLTLDAYVTWLENNGYGPADAELLRGLLAAKLGG